MSAAAARLHPDDIEAIAEAIERRIARPTKAKAKPFLHTRFH